MTDAHFHRNTYDTFLSLEGREVAFFGIHPWQSAECGVSAEEIAADLRRRIAENPHAGVGEIGLDRLKTKNIPDLHRTIFETQLALAAEFRRPVVLHGAKCWGEVVKACQPFVGRIPAFLFHGFSRSAGLLPEIVALNGFVSVGPALLNDHAVNYRVLVKSIPADRLLAETDRTAPTETGPGIGEIVAAVARLRGVAADALAAQLDANAARFDANAV